MYEKGYENWQYTEGSGLFLEHHKFSQTITPLNATCSGYVLLGYIEKNQLHIIAVHIPYGWTLIVHDGCIHGDTGLKGMYMMGMTSDHVSMGTADTVFLKKPDENNIKVNVDQDTNNIIISHPPIVRYDNYDARKFRRDSASYSFILTPPGLV